MSLYIYGRLYMYGIVRPLLWPAVGQTVASGVLSTLESLWPPLPTCPPGNREFFVTLQQFIKNFIKGSVSRVLRWVLLYIIQKLFSRPIIASHKILTFLKGQFTIYIKQADAALYYDMVLSRQY